MKRNLVKLLAVSVVMVMGSTASAEIINTYIGPITVTPGTVAYGEVGTLLNASQTQVGYGGSWYLGSPTAQVAGSNLDHYWVQSTVNEIKWSLSTPVNAVLAFPGNDHGPLPMENMEYMMWGSNNQTDWYVGSLTAIYKGGWDPTDPVLPGGLHDYYATRWDFGQNYQYFKTVGTSSVVWYPAENRWWTDYDPEMDGIAAVPVPGAMLLGAIGLSTAAWRLRRRTA